MSTPTTPFGKTSPPTTNYRDAFYTPPKPRLVSTLGLGISLTTAICCILIIAGHPITPVVLAALIGAAATTATAIATYRHWLTTTARPALMRHAVATVTGQPLPERLENDKGRTLTASRYDRGSLTTPGPAKRIVINARYLAMIDAARLEAISAALARVEGIPYTASAKKGKPGRYIFTPAPKAPTLSPTERIEQRFAKAAKDVFGAGARVAFTWDERNEAYLVAADITGVRGLDIALAGKQNQAGTRLLSQLPDRSFRFSAYPNEDRFVFERSLPLPAIVMPPAGAAVMVTDQRTYRQFEIPLGVGPGGAQAMWRPATDAHLLAIGGTGGGKTICEHGVIQHLTQAGWRVWLVDGKYIEFLGYRQWRNVEFLAQDVDAQIRLIHLAHETMIERYRRIREGTVRAEDLDPIALVIDEVTSLLASVDQRYAETKVKGMRAKAPVLDWLANLGRLARSAKIHMVFGMQRPDTTIIDGELRDNFGARISLGRLKSAAGSVMMWDNHAIGCQVPQIPGRAVSLIDNHPTMIQATLNANPDPNHDDYHAGLIQAMTPAIEIHTRKRIRPPVATITDSEEAPEITWDGLLQAKIVDSTGHKVIFDPVASEESRRFRSGIRPSTTSSPRLLQTAPTLEAGLGLFPETGPTSEALVYGRSIAVALARAFAPTDSTDSTFAASTIAGGARFAAQDGRGHGDQDQRAHDSGARLLTHPDDMPEVGFGNSSADGVGKDASYLTTVSRLQAGQYAMLEIICVEVMVSEVIPGEHDSYLVVGYDDEGYKVTVDLHGGTEVMVRSSDDTDAPDDTDGTEDFI